MIFRLAVAAVRGESLRVAGAGVARDWTYAADVAAGLAHLATVEALPSDLFNLSSGVRVTLREVVRVVRQVVPESRIEIVRRGKVDLALTREDERAALDVSRLRSAGFRAMTPLEEGLRQRPELFVSTLTEKLLTFALGRGVEPYDGPAIRKIVGDAQANDFRFSSLILGIVNSAPFTMRKSL